MPRDETGQKAEKSIPTRMNKKRDNRYKNKTHVPGCVHLPRTEGPAIGPAIGPALLLCSLPASPSQAKPAFSLLQAPWPGLMPHASTCLALPRLASTELDCASPAVSYMYLPLVSRPSPAPSSLDSPIRAASAASSSCAWQTRHSAQSSASLLGPISRRVSCYISCCISCYTSFFSASLSLSPSPFSPCSSPLIGPVSAS